jgi:hypothetical protein
MASVKRQALFFSLLALILCAFMPSDQSIWIDEAQTYVYASQPSLSAWWQKLRTDVFSEPLMPLGMLSAWASGQVFGLSEWQMRLPNVIWMWIAVTAFTFLGRFWQVPWAPLFLAVQPFVWFYANEARPYSMQIACSSVIAISMVRLIEKRSFSPGRTAAILIAANILVATSLFGVLTAAPAVLTTIYLCWRQRWMVSRAVVASAICSLGWWLACGAYYLSVLARGAKGAKLWEVGWLNIGFAFYELFGFAGLGPGRNDLRTFARSMASPGDLASILPYALPIALLAALYFTIILAGRRPVLQSQYRQEGYAIAGVALAAVLSTFGLAMLAHFPFWGRHLAPSFPFVALLLVLLLKSLKMHGRWGWEKAATPLLGLALLSSSLLLRFHPRHAKDDYRSAADAARSALQAGQRVLWSADPQSARYYGVPISQGIWQPNTAIHFLHPRTDDLTAIPRPDVIVTTKPDIYDRHGTIAAFIHDHQFHPSKQFQAITIWAPQQ